MQAVLCLLVLFIIPAVVESQGPCFPRLTSRKRFIATTFAAKIPPPRPKMPTTFPKIVPACLIGLLEYKLAANDIAVVSEKMNLKPTTAIFWVNIAVFLAFQYGERNLDCFNFLVRHFVMPADNQELTKRPHTILLSGFAQFQLSHFLGNMLALAFHGPPVVRALGTRLFSRFYVAAIYASSLIDAY